MTMTARLLHLALGKTACALACLHLVIGGGALAEDIASTKPDIPPMRHLDATLEDQASPPKRSIAFIVSDAYPPFSFRDRLGALRGHAIAIARAICGEARITCRFVVRPFDQLADALEKGEGDAVLAGLRPSPRWFARFDFTRPYLKALGRFAVRRDAAITHVDGTTLTSRRIGVVKGTVHDAWLTRALPQARIHRAASFTAAANLLKSGKIDLLFGDWLPLSYWVAGSASEGCCRLLPGWIPARLFAYNHQAIAVKRGNDELRTFLDKTLDDMQKDGRLRRVIARTLPLLAASPAPRTRQRNQDAKDRKLP